MAVCHGPASDTDNRRGESSMGQASSQQVQTEAREQLQFERLLAEISARFVNVVAEHVDDLIAEAQRTICECLGIDHSALWQASESEPDVFRSTSAAISGIGAASGANGRRCPFPLDRSEA